MKKSVLIVMSLFLMGMTVTLNAQKTKKTEKSQEEQTIVQNLKEEIIMTQEEKNSYALGANVGESFNNAGITAAIIETFKFETFKEGFLDALKGENKFSPDEMQECFNDIQEKMAAKQSQGIEQEKEKGRQFLAENKKRSGVKETASGLQYEAIVMGNGEKPLATDNVKVHYTGKTLDGKVFDSSVERGQPAEFPLNHVIPGWTEGLQLMPVGSKFMLYIPSDLGYGDNGAPGGRIKPGATLIFEVELLGITK